MRSHLMFALIRFAQFGDADYVCFICNQKLYVYEGVSARKREGVSAESIRGREGVSAGLKLLILLASEGVSAGTYVG